MHQGRWNGTFLNSTQVLDIAVITTLCMLSIIAINPLGDFPLADDWAYGWTVKHLLATGDYQQAQIVPSPILTNVVWGTLFCLPGGFNFTALRASSLLALILAAIGGYLTVRELNQSRFVGLVTALTLAFNPIYYAVSFTFDTDALFVALMVWATLFFVRDLKIPSTVCWTAGIGCACAATLSRQLAFCIPLAFATISLFGVGRKWKALLRGTGPLLACFVAYIGFRHWLVASGRVSAFVDGKTSELLRAFYHGTYLLKIALANVFVSLVYLGVFLLPVTLLALRDLAGLKRDLNKHGVGLIVLGSAGALAMAAGAFVRLRYGVSLANISVDETDFAAHDVIALVGSPVWLPLTGLFITRSGIGPYSVNPESTLPDGLWVLLTVLGICGALALIVKVAVYLSELTGRIRRRAPAQETERSVNFLLLTGTLYLLPLMCASVLLDRYPMPAVVFLGLSLAGMSKSGISLTEGGRSRGSFRRLAVVSLVGLILFAVGGTHDNLARNRTRWAGFWDLTRSQLISPQSVDAGEFSALYPGEVLVPFDFQQDLIGPKRAQGLYSVSFASTPANGYVRIKEYEYYNWLPPRIEKVFVLKKQ